MLSFRVVHLLALGLCLLLVAKYMQLMRASVYGLDRLLSRRFFDIDGLTTEIRARVQRSQDAARSWHRTGRHPYLWLCSRLRRAVGLDRGAE